MSETTETEQPTETTTTATTASTATASTTTEEKYPNIFDVAGDGLPPVGEDGKPIMPEWLPGAQFWDAAKGEVRVEDLAKSWKDLRGKVSKGTATAEAPPAQADDYTLPKVEGIPEGLIGGEKDLLWPEIRAAAHKAGVSQKQLDALATPYMKRMAAALAEQEAKLDPEAQKARLKEELRAELQKLGPDGVAYVRDIKGWIAGMEASGKITAEEALEARAMGTAAGVRLLGKFREMIGGQPIPTDALDGDAASQADGQRVLTEGYAEGNQEKIAKGKRILQSLEKAGKLKPPG